MYYLTRKTRFIFKGLLGQYERLYLGDLGEVIQICRVGALALAVKGSHYWCSGKQKCWIRESVHSSLKLPFAWWLEIGLITQRIYA